MKESMRLVISLAFILLIISACGGGEVSAPPSATVASMERVSFVSSLLGPGFSMQIPSTWRYQITDTGIILSNDPRLLGAQDDGAVIPSGSLVANVSLLTEAEVIAIGARNSASLIDAIVGASADDALQPQYSNADLVSFDGRNGAQSFVSIAGSDSLLLALELDRNFLLAIVVSPQGELRQHSSVLNSIFGSVDLLKTN